MPYEIESILDHHLLYYRIHKSYINPNLNSDKKIIPGAFKPKGNDELSTDWNEHTTPELAVKDPNANGLVKFLVEKLRVPSLSLVVEHNPLCELLDGIDNRAHSVIKGLPPKNPSKDRMRILLRDLCEWEIQCPE